MGSKIHAVMDGLPRMQSLTLSLKVRHYALRNTTQPLRSKRILLFTGKVAPESLPADTNVIDLIPPNSKAPPVTYHRMLADTSALIMLTFFTPPSLLCVICYNIMAKYAQKMLRP